MNCESNPKETIERTIEVKVGLRSVIVGRSELDNLIEALSEMKNLAAGGRALINIGAA
jgi:hypothetical protein